jgi:predicted Zn-dependent protease
VLVFAFTLSSCSNSNLTEATNGKTKVMKSTDGKIEVTVPNSWKVENLNNDVAILEVANLSKEQYLLIISEASEDFAEDTKPSDYIQLVLQNIQNVSTNPVASEIKDLKINGLDASQCDISAEVEKMKIKYLLTVIKSEDQFIQVLAWSLNSKYDENKATLESVANSVRVVQ